jgi:hypothetical protein
MSELEQKNGGSPLAKVLNQLNLPTLAMILLMGGGNLLKTNQTSEEMLRAIRQIDDLHDAVREFEARQKDALNKATAALDNQNVLLRNQAMMISNQQQLISQIKGRP